MTSRGKTPILAPVWGNLARRVGRDFQTLFRLEGMDGPFGRHVPEADLFLILNRLRISASSRFGAESWRIRRRVEDKLHDHLRYQAAKRARDFKRRTDFPREKDLSTREDRAISGVDAADERCAFLESFLPPLKRTNPALYQSALAIVARLHVEESWDDQELAKRYVEYPSVRAQVLLLRGRTDLALRRSGFGALRRARKLLGIKWKEFLGRWE